MQSQKQPVTIWQIAKHCQCHPQQMSAIIDYWQARGKIRQCQQTKCASCPLVRCGSSKAYLWQEKL